MQAHRLLTGRQVHAAQGARDGRDRLEAGARDDGSTVGSAALNAARVVGRACQMPVLPAHDLVVRGGTEQGGLGESIADLDALDGLDGHEGAREAGIQAFSRAHVRSQAHRHVVGDDLDDAADGVPRVLCFVHGGLEARVVGRVERAHGRGAQGFFVGGRGHGLRRGTLGAHGHDVRDEANAGHLIEERFGQRAEGDTRGGLAGGGALEDGASLGQIVGEHAGQVGVTRARPRQRAVTRDLALVAGTGINEKSRGIHGVRAHDGLPLGPLRVSDPNSNGSTRGHPVTYTREDRHLVGLELLTSTAPIAQAASGQGTSQVISRDMQSRRKPLDHGKQCGPVRFSGGHPSQHVPQCPTRPSAHACRLSRGERSGRGGLRGSGQIRFSTQDVNNDAQRVVTGSQVRWNRDGQTRPNLLINQSRLKTTHSSPEVNDLRDARLPRGYTNNAVCPAQHGELGDDPIALVHLHTVPLDEGLSRHTVGHGRRVRDDGTFRTHLNAQRTHRCIHTGADRNVGQDVDDINLDIATRAGRARSGRNSPESNQTGTLALAHDHARQLITDRVRADDS